MRAPIDLVVVGLIRQHGQILLVRQRGPSDERDYWVAPGGMVEPGESLSAALAREVAEESGLTVHELGPLAYCTQIDRPARPAQTLAFAFPVLRWSGVPAIADPDNEVLEARWIAQDRAVELLGVIGWGGMRDPLIAYLRGEAPTGTLWQYRAGLAGHELISRIPGAAV